MKLILFNQYVKLDGTDDEVKEIARILTFQVDDYIYSPGVRSGKWDGSVKLLQTRIVDDARIFFFRLGLLDYVCANFQDPIEFIDKRKYNYKYDLALIKDLGLRHHADYSQLEGIKQAVKRKVGIWKCATNFGKTLMAIGLTRLISVSNQVPSAIFTHNSILFDQIKEELIDVCGENIVGMINADVWEPRLINIVMIPTVASKLKNPNESVRDRARTFLASLKLFVVDECHRGSSNTFTAVLSKCSNADFRIGMSGTPLYKDKVDQLRLIQYTGEVIYEVKNAALINHGISACPTIVVEQIPGRYVYPKDFLKLQNRKLCYHFAYEHWMINNEGLLASVVQSAAIHQRAGKDVLIITNRIKQAKECIALFEKEDIYPLFVAGSDMDSDGNTQCIDKKQNIATLDVFREGGGQILVGSPIIDEGISLDNVRVMYLISGGKSARQLLQRVGRAIRKKNDDNTVLIYDYFIKDPVLKKYWRQDGVLKTQSNAYLQDHFIERIQVYQEEGFEIRGLDSCHLYREL